jgi:hypothetical protein
MLFTVNKVLVEWIFGMSFDDHEESFVTLHNRNFTKMILEKLDLAHTNQPTEDLTASGASPSPVF